MRKVLALILVLAVMVTLIGWKRFNDGHSTVAVNVEPVSLGVLSDSVLASGNFVFNHQIQIRPEVSGRVQEVLIEEGEYVKRGQLLLELDPAAYDAEVERVSAMVDNQKIEIARQKETLANLKRQLKRNNQLLVDGLIQTETVDELESAVKIARINVDAAQSALDVSQRNIDMNKFDASKVSHLKQDVFELLREYDREGIKFDVIILDPPKFVESKRSLMKAARGYKDINRLAFRLLKPGGYLLTFSCSGLMPADLYQKIVADGALDAGIDAQIIKRLEQDEDHPIATGFPEGYYLKGFVCRV